MPDWQTDGGSQRRIPLAPAGKNFDFAKALTAERVKQCAVPMAGGFSYNWAAKAADEGVISALNLLEAFVQARLKPKYEGFEGE